MSRTYVFLVLLAALVLMSDGWARAAPPLGILPSEAERLGQLGRMPLMLAALEGDGVAPGLLSAPLWAAATGSKNERRSNTRPRLTTLHIPRPRLVLQILAAGPEDVPLLFRESSFNAASLAMAVNHCVAIGEEASLKELAFRSSEEVGWVCRILFTPKGHEPLRPPMYGDLGLPYDSMPLGKWPLFPVVHSGKTYFVLGLVQAVEGHPERAADYLDYCRKNGIFRKTPVPVPTRRRAMKDAAALRHSDAWKAIRWSGTSPQESAKLRDTYIGAFIQAQAESIPTK